MLLLSIFYSIAFSATARYSIDVGSIDPMSLQPVQHDLTLAMKQTLDTYASNGDWAGTIGINVGQATDSSGATSTKIQYDVTGDDLSALSQASFADNFASTYGSISSLSPFPPTGPGVLESGSITGTTTSTTSTGTTTSTGSTTSTGTSTGSTTPVSTYTWTQPGMTATSLQPYIGDLRQAMADATGISPDQINVALSDQNGNVVMTYTINGLPATALNFPTFSDIFQSALASNTNLSNAGFNFSPTTTSTGNTATTGTSTGTATATSTGTTTATSTGTTTATSTGTTTATSTGSTTATSTGSTTATSTGGTSPSTGTGVTTTYNWQGTWDPASLNPYASQFPGLMSTTLSSFNANVPASSISGSIQQENGVTTIQWVFPGKYNIAVTDPQFQPTLQNNAAAISGLACALNLPSCSTAPSTGTSTGPVAPVTPTTGTTTGSVTPVVPGRLLKCERLSRAACQASFSRCFWFVEEGEGECMSISEFERPERPEFELPEFERPEYEGFRPIFPVTSGTAVIPATSGTAVVPSGVIPAAGSGTAANLPSRPIRLGCEGQMQVSCRATPGCAWIVEEPGEPGECDEYSELPEAIRAGTFYTPPTGIATGIATVPTTVNTGSGVATTTAGTSAAGGTSAITISGGTTTISGAGNGVNTVTNSGGTITNSGAATGASTGTGVGVLTTYGCENLQEVQCRNTRGCYWVREFGELGECEDELEYEDLIRTQAAGTSTGTGATGTVTVPSSGVIGYGEFEAPEMEDIYPGQFTAAATAGTNPTIVLTPGMASLPSTGVIGYGEYEAPEAEDMFPAGPGLASSFGSAASFFGEREYEAPEYEAPEYEGGVLPANGVIHFGEYEGPSLSKAKPTSDHRSTSNFTLLYVLAACVAFGLGFGVTHMISRRKQSSNLDDILLDRQV